MQQTPLKFFIRGLRRPASIPARPRDRAPDRAQGIESSKKLGRHRWKIERTMAWLGGYCRLTIRYERNGHNFL